MNTTGSLVMKAERVGSETMLAQIVNMVAQAQRSRAPIQALADKVAGVVRAGGAGHCGADVRRLDGAGAGAASRLRHHQRRRRAHHRMSVRARSRHAHELMVGIGRGAQVGVLIRNAEAIENLAKVDTLVVDKTGTLTEGKPKLAQILPVGGVDEKELLRLTASLEQGSEHPLAARFVQGALANAAPLEAAKDFQSTTAGGVAGTVAGRSVLVGKPAFLRESGVTELGPRNARPPHSKPKAQTAIFVAIDGRAAGVLTVADPIKSTTAEAIAELRELGVNVSCSRATTARTAKPSPRSSESTTSKRASRRRTNTRR